MSRVNIKTVAVCAVVSTTVVCGGAVMAAPLVGLFAAGAATGAAVTGVSTPCGDRPGTVTVAMTGVHLDGYSTAQMSNALAIVRAGQEMGVPPRGLVVAIATALQESELRNLANPAVPASLNLPHDGVGTDHDSVGLFQQRPSWGSTDQLMNPAEAARRFYTALLKVDGWQQLPVTIAAQRVQRSAFPDAYAKHEPVAARIVDTVAGGAAKAGPVSGTCATVGQVAASGWVAPVDGGIVSGFRTPDRPDHNGVDLAAAKHTVVRAAAAGTVITAVCQPSTAAVRSCDLDGSLSVPGCGWYVDIQHAGGIITRYCHLVSKPLVVAGQTVAAGQQIGWSGTSGNSSGPHLHFEVHRNNDASASGAIDPIPFMRDHGALLGAAKTI